MSKKKIIYFLLIAVLAGCSLVKNEKKEQLSELLNMQRTDKYTINAKNYKAKLLPKIEDFWKSQTIEDKYKNFIIKKVHNEGFFYNRSHDTIYVLSTHELSVKESLIANIESNKKIQSLVTNCFVFIKIKNEFIFQNKINFLIFLEEVISENRLYNEKAKNKIFESFVDYIIKNKNTYYSDSYFNEISLDLPKSSEKYKLFNHLYNYHDF